MTSHFFNFLAQTTNIVITTPTAPLPDPTQQPPAWMQFIPIPLIGLLVYFGFIRPQATAKKEQDNLIKAAKTGDKIVTTGGIFGLITNVKEGSVVVKIADNVKIELEKAHIARIIKEQAEVKP